MRNRKVVFCGAIAIMFAGCGGGGSSSSSTPTPTPTPPPTPSPTVQQRIDAATTTVTHNTACTSITPFYWEIGDATGALGSGTGGDNSTTAPNSATVMEIASASKWIFGAYALEQNSYANIKSAQHLNGNSDITLLNFTSGYDNMGPASCTLQNTVGSCFSALSTAGNGGYNSDYHAADVGKFYYSSGHLQSFAANVAGLGSYYKSNVGGSPLLADEIRNKIGQEITLIYSNPALAGGISTDAADYAVFLRKIMAGGLQMSQHLSADPVCAWTGFSDCNALYSPINGTGNDISNEKWHYSLAHWIEDDPTVGDGAFSSPGAFGFYPWIDSSKTYYGILARHDTSTAQSDPKQAPYATSVNCGRLIRKAWLQAVAQ